MNLLDRAKRMLQGQGAGGSQKAQYYNVLCPDGHRISGARNEGYQALRCPSCGEGVFILPRSPLPEVATPPRPASRPAREPTPEPTAVLDEPIALTDAPPPPPQRADADLPEIDWEDAPEPVRAPNPKAPERPGSRAEEPATPVQQPARSRAPRPGRASAPRPEIPEVEPHTPVPPFDPVDWARRHRNPLIFGSVALILAGTVVMRQWRTQLLDSPRIAEVGRTEGIKALDQGEWDKAHQLLSRAKRAVDALGGKVEGAEEIRHAADEAELYANRLSESLESLLAQANPADDSDWPRTFRNLYKGKAVIVVAEVTAVPGVDSATEYELDYRVLPNGEGDLDRGGDVRVGRFDLKDFALVRDLQPKQGTELRFGARLRSFTYNAERNEWLVGLEPDSGVILQHQGALDAAMMTAEALTTPEEGQQ